MNADAEILNFLQDGQAQSWCRDGLTHNRGTIEPCDLGDPSWPSCVGVSKLARITKPDEQGKPGKGCKQSATITCGSHTTLREGAYRVEIDDRTIDVLEARKSDSNNWRVKGPQARIR